MSTATGLGAGRMLDTAGRPAVTVTTVHELKTSDGATVRGVLSRVPGARTVVCLMHPRQDLTHHPLVPALLRAGAAVWTQHTRSVNNDLNLVHEQAVLDVAAGIGFLREQEFDSVVALGHSGGGTLYAFYAEQSGLPPGERIARTPGGRPTGFAEADMPQLDGAVFYAPHPGQGRLLMACIDPSVIDEEDPDSIDPELYAFDPANGFAEPPGSSRFTLEFVDRYRVAQRERITRIDAHARELLDDAKSSRTRFAESDDPVDRRRAIMPRIITVYRTDADPRTVDLRLDSNERPYGSVFGKRPDLINHGLVGFGRLSTPEAWLSTWSGNASNADFARCAPGVTVPSLFIELTGDQAGFPADSARMRAALGGTDKSARAVRGTHFGGAIARGERTGNELVGDEVVAWLGERFDLADVP
ncbi:alpha/beta hydrolase family protein [Tsukamurella soli]|uniref:Alpha/beta fold hydrolase n=1 Tax=Tsukamurella soli TaxID=644556 RepID=A0ABP8JKH5_9ACTN